MGVKYGFIKTDPPVLIARILHFFLARLAKLKPTRFKLFFSNKPFSQLMMNLMMGPVKLTIAITFAWKSCSWLYHISGWRTDHLSADSFCSKIETFLKFWNFLFLVE